MKNRRRGRTILLILLLVFVLIQFLPVDRSVPETNPTQDFIYATQPSAAITSLFRDACYDCHSYETEYPWYSYITPVGQWLQGHVNNGREHLNFSVWTTYSAEDKEHALEEMIEMISEGKMPLNSFTWLHPEARLTDAQREEMTDWVSVVQGGRGGVTPK